MPHCNILIGVDQNYYNNWGINLVKSIQYYNSFIQCHVHIVNPDTNFEKIKNVDYTTETKSFVSETNKLGYLQAVRFLKVAEKISDTNLFMTLDADTICTKEFSINDFYSISKDVTVLKHPKENRWLAGCVTFGTGNFANDYRNSLLEFPTSQWEFGHDQKVLPDLHNKYNFKEINGQWMSIGKNGRNSIFLTLKGTQKVKDKYVKIYDSYLEKMNN